MWQTCYAWPATSKAGRAGSRRGVIGGGKAGRRRELRLYKARQVGGASRRARAGRKGELSVKGNDGSRLALPGHGRLAWRIWRVCHGVVLLIRKLCFCQHLYDSPVCPIRAKWIRNSSKNSRVGRFVIMPTVIQWDVDLALLLGGRKGLLEPTVGMFWAGAIDI